jgi:hypothetical protein
LSTNKIKKDFERGCLDFSLKIEFYNSEFLALIASDKSLERIQEGDDNEKAS